MTTLTNRLSGLLRTLGSDYFKRDILEPTPASGEAQNDPKAHRDVTPERFLRLEKELVRGKAEVVSRPFIFTKWRFNLLANQVEANEPAL